MKLYYVQQAPVGQRWQGTQVDAKQCGKTFASDFTQREVPVDKPNLLQFLNAEELTVLQLRPQDVTVAPTNPDPLEAAELRAVAEAQGKMIENYKPRLTATGIVAFILDDATVAQAEAIFAALGTRFKEQANAAR